MGHLGSRKADGPCGGQGWRPPASIKGLDCLSKPLPRNWIRQYPALVNCTTINWFSEWPREALLEVAEKYLVGVDLGTQENVSAPHLWHPAPGPLLRPSSTHPHSAFSILSHGPQIHRKVAKIFVTMHWSVARYSQKMLLELRRHNYVTPTNYLELVSGYKRCAEAWRAGRPGELGDMMGWDIPGAGPGSQGGRHPGGRG